MEAKANAKFVRISPRKVNVVLDLVRGKDVKYAEAVLKHTPKAACEPLLKLLNSAMANAENNHDMDVSKLYIAQCNATAGPILNDDKLVSIQNVIYIKSVYLSCFNTGDVVS
jgi:large subunit ribosomal protein L22